jgi:hypothetical protein
MYIVHVKNTGEKFLSYNPREDDICKSIVELQFNTTPDNIDFYITSDSLCFEIRMGKPCKPVLNNGAMVLEEYESVIDDPDNEGQALWQNLLATHQTQLISYPYDENGNFVIPEEFIP